MDLIILVATLVCLVSILKPFTFPGDTKFEDAYSSIALFLGFIAYFYGIDFFPANSFLAPFHLITIGLVNSFAIIDLFFTSVIGVPLSLQLIFLIIIPAMIAFSLTRAILKYVVVFSELTSDFFALMIAYVSMIAAVRGDFNLVQWVLGAFVGTAKFLSGQGSILATTTAFFLGCAFIILLSSLFESMTVSFITNILSKNKEAE